MAMWHETYTNITAFAKHLVDEGYDAKELLGYFEKPWHWTSEYLAWRESLNEGGS